MQPVNLGGVIISNASLHNFDEINKKNINVLDLVEIERAGDVIPQVLSIDKSKRKQDSKKFNFPIKCLCGAETKKEISKSLVSSKPKIIFHLAAIVSGQAEEEFDLGWNINTKGSWGLFESIRELGDDYKPRLVFTSSIAVFGAPFPEKIPDDFFTTPLTSYGAQKAISELLLADYSRKGMVDGISIRLPTICVRPGKPNLAASGFFSGIIREPLNGIEARLPVSTSVRHWHASPRSAAGFLLHAAEIDTCLLYTSPSPRD